MEPSTTPNVRSNEAGNESVGNTHRVLIIVENLPVPLDRRVWQEATTLRDAGYTVSVICPKGVRYQAAQEVVDGIHIFRHPLPVEADRALGYALEYGSALFWELVLAIRVYRTVGFDVIQACNPPDTIFLLARLFKLFAGTPFIFDHHDINPELYEAKFGKQGFFHRLLLRLERWTFRTADASIATNETFAEIAVDRGGMDPSNVFIVRSIPDLTRFKRIAANDKLRNGRKHLLGYVGIIGAQDGVDLLIHAMSEIVHNHGRQDIQCAIVGSGTEIEALQKLSAVLDVKNNVTFTGFLSGEDLLAAFSTFDVGVIPDPKNTYNDKISMNKVFEYMTLGIPFVQFDLDMGSRLAQDAALYARDNDPKDLANRLMELVDNPAKREEMSSIGLARADQELNWTREQAELLAAYDCAFAAPKSKPAKPNLPASKPTTATD